MSLENDCALDTKDFEVLTDISFVSDWTCFSLGLLLGCLPYAEFGLLSSYLFDFPSCCFLSSKTSLWFVRNGDVGLSFLLPCILELFVDCLSLMGPPSILRRLDAIWVRIPYVEGGLLDSVLF